MLTAIDLNSLPLIAAAIGIPIAVLGLSLKWFIFASNRHHRHLDLLAHVAEKDLSSPTAEDILFVEEALTRVYGQYLPFAVYRLLRQSACCRQLLRLWKYVYSVFEVSKDGQHLQHRDNLKKVWHMSIPTYVAIRTISGFSFGYVGLLLVVVGVFAAFHAYWVTAVAGVSFGIPFSLVGYRLFDQATNVAMYNREFIAQLGSLFRSNT